MSARTVSDKLLDLYAHLSEGHITEFEFLEQAEAMTTSDTSVEDLLNQLGALVNGPDSEHRLRA